MSSEKAQKEEILRLENLQISILEDKGNNGKTGQEKNEKEIIHGLSLVINQGEIHAFMGPNGSGKSTLSNAIMGHPAYKVTSGKIFFKGKDITDIPTHERARLGIFLSFQYPVSLPGVSMTNFLRTAVNSMRGEISVREFRLLLNETMTKLQIDPSFTRRYVNEGFSGGEKKRMELLQMLMLKPKIAILDEIDSGLDIDALKIVSQGINSLISDNISLLLITHYQRILDIVKPHFVHIFAAGKLLKSGGPELALKLEKEGYDWILNPKEAGAK
jgi:Fe-S cluster assembly ATP-binding protein